MSSWLKWLLVSVIMSGIVVVNLFRYNESIETSPLNAHNRTNQSEILTSKIDSIQSVEQLAELQFVQTFSRPLFSETRKKYIKPVPVKKKPPPKKVVKKAAPPKPVPKIKILGISMSNGLRRTLVKLPKQPNAKWIEQGAKINGWEIVEITTDSVKIGNANREVSIALFPEKK